MFGISQARTVFSIGLLSLIANFICRFGLRQPDVADFTLGLAITTLMCGLVWMARDQRNGNAA